MRPIDKGGWPEINGQPVVFTRYQYAKGYLFDRVGQYCSYCEQHIPAMGAVEHVTPKSIAPDREFEWDNFLLSCVNCNSVKLATPINIDDYFWPDRHNTLLVIKYDETGIPKPMDNLPSPEKTKAENLIRLVGLEKTRPPQDSRVYEQASDMRWTNRVASWYNAKESLTDYLNAPQSMRPQIAKLVAKCTISGFWSVWFEVFKDCHEVRKELIDVLPGIAKDCFDMHGKPIPRNGTGL